MKFIDLQKQYKEIKVDLNESLNDILENTSFIMGPPVQELESKLAKYVGVKHCISCSSGTDAILMALMSLEVKPGDAVFLSSFTYIATAEVVSLLGATPIFVDSYDSTFNMSHVDLEDRIAKVVSEGKLIPKAIIAVDIFGLPARYRLIEEVSKKHNLPIIEDAAQSFGSEIKNKKACSFGLIATTSFFPAKPLGCYGDGGAIFTDDDHLNESLRSIRIHGKGQDKYDNIRTGINGRLDTIQAAVLLEKIKIFDDELISRNNVAKRYTEGLSDILRVQYIPKDYQCSWAQFSLLCDSEEQRTDIMNFLKSKNIPSMIYYQKPMHMQAVYAYLNYNPEDLPVSNDLSKRIFSLPMHPYLSNEEVDLIVQTIQNFLKK
jgi:dTDP-4-amino-4,6-dideoxygalactose transaminase